jgi:hypothetical protein
MRRYSRSIASTVFIASLVIPVDLSHANDELISTVDEFQATLENQWSYLHAGETDLIQLISDLRDRVENGDVPAHRLPYELQKIVGAGIDGHASVSPTGFSGAYFLPFLIEPIGDRFVAFLPDRSNLVAANYPYVVAINGRPIDEWIEKASEVVADGSPQLVNRRSVGELRRIDHWRTELGAEVVARAKISVQLTNLEYDLVINRDLNLVLNPPKYGIWPRAQDSGWMADDRVGYIRLAAMDRESVDVVNEWMPRFINAEGLIVDVRGNGGGSRTALIDLAKYLIDTEHDPIAVNTSVYRQSPKFGKDWLVQRFMYRQSWPGWSKPERRAIERFKEKFKPAYEFLDHEYSDWHYLVLSGRNSGRFYHFAKPVIVLMNAQCFSATDIFLAAMKEIPGVILMGQPSGGGSARTDHLTIEGGRIRLQLGSMISYQPNGHLFDGHGVQPDILINPNPSFYLNDKPDHVLDTAVDTILNPR